MSVGITNVAATFVGLIVKLCSVHCWYLPLAQLPQGCREVEDAPQKKASFFVFFYYSHRLFAKVLWCGWCIRMCMGMAWIFVLKYFQQMEIIFAKSFCCLCYFLLNVVCEANRFVVANIAQKLHCLWFLLFLRSCCKNRQALLLKVVAVVVVVAVMAMLLRVWKQLPFTIKRFSMPCEVFGKCVKSSSRNIV